MRPAASALITLAFVAFVALLGAACGANVSADGGDLCLRWSDAGAAAYPVPTTLPDDLACEVVDGTSTTPLPGSTIVYTCVEASTPCPGPAAAHASFATCVGEGRDGPGCDHPLSGECTERKTLAACGPDPAAVGACCYYAVVLDQTFISSAASPTEAMAQR